MAGEILTGGIFMIFSGYTEVYVLQNLMNSCASR